VSSAACGDICFRRCCWSSCNLPSPLPALLQRPLSCAASHSLANPPALFWFAAGGDCSLPPGTRHAVAAAGSGGGARPHRGGSRGSACPSPSWRGASRQRPRRCHASVR
jgi:hypothetical protein